MGFKFCILDSIRSTREASWDAKHISNYDVGRNFETGSDYHMWLTGQLDGVVSAPERIVARRLVRPKVNRNTVLGQPFPEVDDVAVVGDGRGALLGP